jgi:hypothetical protein
MRFEKKLDELAGEIVCYASPSIVHANVLQFANEERALLASLAIRLSLDNAMI